MELMSTWDYYAGAAMQGLVASYMSRVAPWPISRGKGLLYPKERERIAAEALMMADEMMRQRQGRATVAGCDRSERYFHQNKD